MCGHRVNGEIPWDRKTSNGKGFKKKKKDLSETILQKKLHFIDYLIFPFA